MLCSFKINVTTTTLEQDSFQFHVASQATITSVNYLVYLLNYLIVATMQDYNFKAYINKKESVNMFLLLYISPGFGVALQIPSYNGSLIDYSMVTS